MTVFVGCELGQKYGFSASITGKAALLDLSEPGVALVGWGPGFDSIPLKGNLLVLWHLDAIETFHGFYDPVKFAGNPRPRWAGDDKFYTCCRRLDPKGMVSEAGSVAVQAVAAVVEIPAAGLIYVTSGRYGSRKWMVHTITTAGATVESLKDYRARALKAEGV